MSRMVDLPQIRTAVGTVHRPPVFLVGAPRSGTTLLYKALCLHPDAAWVSNWVRRFPQVRPLAAANRLARRMPAQRRAVWFGADSNAYVFGPKRSLGNRLFPMPVEGEPLFVRCGLRNEVPGPDGPDPAQMEALRRAFSATTRYSGAPVMVSKRIVNNRVIPVLAAAFPGARFVNLVRDGRAVAYSLSRVDWWEDSLVWWYGATPRRWREDGGDPWEMVARHWPEELAAIEVGLATVPPDDVMRVSYESFINDPQGVLGDIALFAGLREDAPWRAEIDRLDFPNRNEAWRTDLGDAVVRRIEDLQHERLLAHGYVT